MTVWYLLGRSTLYHLVAFYSEHHHLHLPWTMSRSVLLLGGMKSVVRLCNRQAACLEHTWPLKMPSNRDPRSQSWLSLVTESCIWIGQTLKTPHYACLIMVISVSCILWNPELLLTFQHSTPWHTTLLQSILPNSLLLKRSLENQRLAPERVVSESDILGLALFKFGSFFCCFRGLKLILDQLSKSHITHSSPIMYFFQLSLAEKPDYSSDVHFTKAFGQVKSELWFPLVYHLWSSTSNDENRILFIAMCSVESLAF